MKRRSTFIIGFAIFSMVVGCGPKPVNKGYVDDTPDELIELVENKYHQSVYAIGTADGPNETIARNKATMQARAELARQFQAEVNALQKDYLQAVNGHPGDEHSQVMEVFSSMDISGSSIAKSMIRQKDSDSFSAKVLVVISAEKLKELLDDKTRSYTSFRAMEAYKKLEQRVKRERQMMNNISD